METNGGVKISATSIIGRKQSILFVTMLVVLFPFQASMNQLEDHATDPQNSDFPNIIQVQGQSFLNFTGNISLNSQVNATWFAEVTISESYGTDLLENRSMGLLRQIDEYIGNSDGWIDSAESQEFSELVASSRNWTDSGSGGCCRFDYNPMYVIGDLDIDVTPPETGPINRTVGNWSWTESANISGASDGRTLRLIDIPRIGALIEEVPLRIQLPNDWEFRYSPMSGVSPGNSETSPDSTTSGVISGSPGLFTVHRSQAPVAFDIRITITQNMPPIISTIRFPPLSMTIPLHKASSFSASCSDSPLDSLQIQWTASREGQEIEAYHNSWFEVVPNEIGFSHGEVMSVNATCFDFHGESSHWVENLTLDGVNPSWQGSVVVGGSAKYILDPTNISTILAPAGSTLSFEINGSDDSNQPVLLELYTNISEGWTQSGFSEQTFEFVVNQGMGVNGADMSLYDRHLERKPSEISVALLVTDEAGNSDAGQWTVRVLDSNPPTVIPRFSSNGAEVEIGDDIHENNLLQLDLSHSFDDLDPIGNVTWSVWIDGNELIWDIQNWSVMELIQIPQLTQGVHEIIVKATDSKGNLREENVSMTVLPRSGAHISIVEVSLSGGSKIGSTAILTVIVQNDGADLAYARVCLSEICGRWTGEPFASTLQNGPEQRTIEFQFEMENDSLEGLYLNWDSASAGTNGNIPIDVEIESEDKSPTFYILLLVIIISLTFVAHSSSREGTE
jgi:hypothetical protein